MKVLPFAARPPRVVSRPRRNHTIALYDQKSPDGALADRLFLYQRARTRVEDRRARAMKEIQIPRNEIQFFRKEIQAGGNKFQIRRNEIQIKILHLPSRIEPFLRLTRTFTASSHFLPIPTPGRRGSVGVACSPRVVLRSSFLVPPASLSK